MVDAVIFHLLLCRLPRIREDAWFIAFLALKVFVCALFREFWRCNFRLRTLVFSLFLFNGHRGYIVADHRPVGL